MPKSTKDYLQELSQRGETEAIIAAGIATEAFFKAVFGDDEYLDPSTGKLLHNSGQDSTPGLRLVDDTDTREATQEIPVDAAPQGTSAAIIQFARRKTD